jgi:hypothetical protein
MEDLQAKLSKITNINTYRFKASIVKEILEEFRKQIAKEEFFYQALQIDEKHHPVYVEHSRIMKIIDEFINMDEYVLKYTPNSIRDGYGNIVVAYNGDPYATLRLLLMAIRTHNNIVFFSKRYYAVNTELVETLNMICTKKQYADRIASVEYDVIDNAIYGYHHFFNFLIYIGDKRDFQPLKKKISIPFLYSSYGTIDVFIENKDNKELLLEMDKFAKEHGIRINYYDNTSSDETLRFINKYDILDYFVVLSKNTDTIYKFMSELKAKNIYINKNPFENYKLAIREKEITYSKNIIMN